MKILVDKIKVNPDQPRRHFRRVEMDQLKTSIREVGLITPITVEDNGDGTYTLVAGERRLRAVKSLGSKEIEANVQKPSDRKSTDLLVKAGAENIARADMNPIEEANVYKSLMDRGMNVTTIAKKLGTSTPNIYDKLKLLKFTEEEQQWMAEGDLTTVDLAVDALLSVPTVEERVAISRLMAERRAPGSVVIRTCQKWVTIKKQVRTQKKEKKNTTPATEPLENKPPEWDALYQVNRVPPWKVFTESVMSTCDTCSLRQHASDATCGTCPLVTFVRTTLERTNHAQQPTKPNLAAA